jgi:hypothetical protein
VIRSNVRGEVVRPYLPVGVDFEEWREVGHVIVIDYDVVVVVIVVAIVLPIIVLPRGTVRGGGGGGGTAVSRIRQYQR